MAAGTDESTRALCDQCRTGPVWHPGALGVDGRFCESCITRCLETDTDPRCPVCHAAIVRILAVGHLGERIPVLGHLRDAIADPHNTPDLVPTPTTEGGTR